MPSFLIDQNEYIAGIWITKRSNPRNGVDKVHSDTNLMIVSGENVHMQSIQQCQIGKFFQMKTPLGTLDASRFAEVVNARFAMFTLMGTFFIEGFLGHGILSS